MRATLFLCVTALLLQPTAPAQDLKDLVDTAIERLRFQQDPEGSYGHDPVTTAKALLAYADSPRAYRESDGPLIRDAVDWLAAQVNAQGEIAGVEDASEAARVSLWIEKALGSMQSESARETLRRLQRQREMRPVAPAFDGELFALRQDESSDLATALEHRLALWKSMAPGSAGFHRELREMPALVTSIARFQPDLTLGSGEEARHWSIAVSEQVLRAPEELSLVEWTAYARALSECYRHLPAPAGDGTGAPPSVAGTPRPRTTDIAAAYREAATAALGYLEGQQQEGRFGFMGQEDPGITALCLAAVIVTCQQLEQPLPGYVDQGLDWLVSKQNAQGAIEVDKVKVYVTSAAVMALQARGRPSDREPIDRAAQYLKVIQSDEGEGYHSETDWSYGGIDYGDDLRPDLSNTQFGLEALHLAGVSPEDAAMQRALIFLQRCQNDPEINDMVIQRPDGKTVVPGNDGGSGYYPGESKAGLVAVGDGKFMTRSYGSMTYALLKSYLFAGVAVEDPRVQAALDWIQKNYTVEYNPGFDRQRQPGSEYQGLYYYYFTMAKALDASGLQVVKTPEGQRRNWREELSRHLLDIGFQEGYWSNTRSARWWEEIPPLATAYTLTALHHCLPREE